jgi:hypothetical protein
MLHVIVSSPLVLGCRCVSCLDVAWAVGTHGCASLAQEPEAELLALILAWIYRNRCILDYRVTRASTYRDPTVALRY